MSLTKTDKTNHRFHATGKSFSLFSHVICLVHRLYLSWAGVCWCINTCCHSNNAGVPWQEYWYILISSLLYYRQHYYIFSDFYLLYASRHEALWQHQQGAVFCLLLLSSAVTSAEYKTLWIPWRVACLQMLCELYFKLHVEATF